MHGWWARNILPTKVEAPLNNVLELQTIEEDGHQSRNRTENLILPIAIHSTPYANFQQTKTSSNLGLNSKTFQGWNREFSISEITFKHNFKKLEVYLEHEINVWFSHPSKQLHIQIMYSRRKSSIIKITKVR